MTSIGDETFSACYDLISVTIPNSVTSIGKSAFYMCSGLTSVTIPDGVTSIGDWTFGHCYGLTSVTIPNSVTSIGKYAFYCCSDLKSVTIPDGVTSIGNSAFGWCFGLTSVTIGKGVMSIGDSAFDRLKKLTEITCMATTVPETDKSAFNSSNFNATLHVPAASLTDYQNAEPWNQFKNMKAITVGIADISANDIKVRSEGGVLSVSDVPVGTIINVYDLGGNLRGSAKASSKTTAIATSLRSGEIGIVKIGEKSMKFTVK